MTICISFLYFSYFLSNIITHAVCAISRKPIQITKHLISDTLLGISKFGSISKIFLIKFNTVEYCKVTHKDDPPFLFIILSYNFNYLLSEKDHYHECDKTCT